MRRAILRGSTMEKVEIVIGEAKKVEYICATGKKK